MPGETTETRFTITIDTQPVAVRFQPRRFADYGHFEFTSPHPGGRLPMSATGYRSHFSPMWEVEEAPSVEAYARELGHALARQKAPALHDDADSGDRQLTLF